MENDYIKLLAENNVYLEKTVSDKFCYKFQPKGEQIIIVVDADQAIAAKKIIDELNIKGVQLK